jgi:hypothetical protein
VATTTTSFTMKDKWTNNLAVGLLFVFFTYFGIALVDGLFLSSPNDYSGIEKISTALGFIPGAILGYYFQQGRIQSLVEQVQREKREASRARNTVARTSRLSPSKNKEIELLKEQLKTKDEIAKIADRERKLRART